MENKEYRCLFEEINKNPEKRIRQNAYVFQIVNAAAIANDISWEETVRKLADASHELSVLPERQECIKRFMSKCGFVRSAKPRELHTVDEFSAVLSEIGQNHETVIVVCGKNYRNKNTAVLMPDENGVYRCCGLKDIRGYYVSEAWVRTADLMHAGVRHVQRPSGVQKRAAKIPENHAYFTYTMKNPHRIYTGDCVLRALSSVLGISWDEVLDQLLECTGYTNLIVNNAAVFGRLLSNKGFIRHSRPTDKDGKGITGKEFCEKMNSECRNGERVFAYSGRSHVIAVMPIDCNGTIRYMIEDTWDSSERKVGEYWVESCGSKSNFPKKRSYPVIWHTYTEGQTITHPEFGEGKILELWSDEELRPSAVEFSDGSVRIISLTWLYIKLSDMDRN